MIQTIVVTFDSANNEFDFVFASDDGSSSNWFIAVTGPNGTIKALPGTPDVTAAFGTLSVANTDDAFISGGIYTLEVRLWPDGVSGNEEIKTIDFTLDDTGEITYSISNTTTDITFSDTTVYANRFTGGTFDRSNTVQFPSVAGIPATPDYVFTSASYTTSMVLSDGIIYSNAIWRVSGETVVLTEYNSGVWKILFDKTYSGSAEKKVLLNGDLCGVIDCIDTAWQAIIDDACARGGVSKLSDSKRDQLYLLIGNLSLYRHWLECRNYEKAEEYYLEITKLVDVTCTLPTTPQAASSENIYYDAWTTLPSGDFESGFSPGSVPFQFKVVNNLLWFKGTINASGFTAAGANMVLKSYWDSVGITLEPNTVVLAADMDTSSPGNPLRIQVSSGGNLRAGGSATSGHEFAIAGAIPIQ